jgi:DNA (cytosine-5)-methyltransferase 1
MTQTPVIGPLGRRLTVREAARLQGLPEWFDFGSQPDWASFKQLGNGINIGAAWWVLRQYVKRHEKLLPAHVSQPILQASPPLAGALLRPQRPRSVA